MTCCGCLSSIDTYVENVAVVNDEPFCELCAVNVLVDGIYSFGQRFLLPAIEMKAAA